MPETADRGGRAPGRHPAQADQADQAVRGYIEAITPEHRPLFDRLHRLILQVRPDAAVVLSYQIPTYKAGRRPSRSKRATHPSTFHPGHTDNKGNNFLPL
jgi:hypothetical protein